MPQIRLVALALLAGAATSFVAALLRPRPRPHAGVVDLSGDNPQALDLRETAAVTPGHAA